MFRKIAAFAAVATVLGAMAVVNASAQTMGGMSGTNAKTAAAQPPLSPPAKTAVSLTGADITIHYSAPSVRNRKIFGGLVPFGVVWRTGANAATTLKTSGNLMIGSLNVPAGTYTLYSMPGENAWKLIVNKQTGQWGTTYKADQDLGRVDLKVAKNAAPIEKMVIDFEKTSGATTTLHIKWADLDLSVPVMTEK
uniref:DUF2911 domain-containing protein n=1 Tax=mine drainage metagenome TaxID=410659 RepID=E6PWU0_9ZZZZ